MKEEKLVQAGKLTDFCREGLIRAGIPDQDASIIAYTMVEAELRGITSHGVTLLTDYIQQLRQGDSNPRPNMKIIQENYSIVVLDGDNAVGSLAAYKAMEMAINKAKDCSLSGVAVRNVNTCGALICYTTLAIERGMIGFMTASAYPFVPPYGGKTGRLGTNPYSFAIPAGEELPIILDMATTVAAHLKIRLAARNGNKIPLNWATDRDGMPTDDPAKALAGFPQWMGGPKGYGLAVVAQVLAGILSTVSYGGFDSPIESNVPIKLGHFMAAVNIESFMPLKEFTDKVDQLIKDLKTSERIEDVEEILLPGERGLRTKEERLNSGIPITLPIWDELAKIGKELNIDSYIE